MKIFTLGMIISLILNFSACLNSSPEAPSFETIVPKENEKTETYSYEDIKKTFGQYSYISYIITENIRMASKMNNKYGYINDRGEVVIPFVYEFADDFKQGLAVVRKNGKYGVINQKNSLIIPTEYDYIGNYYNHRFVIKDNQKYGVMDETGKNIIPCIYDSLEVSFKTFMSRLNVISDYIVAEKDGHFGVISNSGETLIPFEYDSITGINNETVIVCKNDLWGVLSTDNKNIYDLSEFPYTHIGGDYLFKGRLFDSTACLCNTSGEILTKPGEYIPVDYNEEIGITAYGIKGKVGLLNEAGVPKNIFIHDRLTYMGKNYFNFSKDDISGVLKDNRCVIMDFEYSGDVLLDDEENIYYMNKEESLLTVLSSNGIVIERFEAVNFTLSRDSLLLILKDETMTIIPR